MPDRDVILARAKALIAAIDVAATAEAHDGKAKPGYWKSARARLVELLKEVPPTPGSPRPSCTTHSACMLPSRKTRPSR
jgi:hypothetical protein